MYRRVFYYSIIGLVLGILIIICHNNNMSVLSRIDDVYINSYNMLNTGEIKDISIKTKTENDIYDYFDKLVVQKSKIKNISYSNYKEKNLNSDLYKNINLYYDIIKSYIENESEILNYLKSNSRKEDFINYLKQKEVYEVFIDHLDNEIKDEKLFDYEDIYKKLLEDQEKFNDLLKYVEYLKSISDKWYYIDGEVVCKNEDLVQAIKSKNMEYGIDINVSLDQENLSENKDIGIDDGKKIPVLMYHGVSDETWGLEGLFIKVADFENQMKYIHDNYETIFIEDIKKDYANKKVVALTFDDGYVDFYNNVLPILKKYNLKANLYIITNYKSDNFLSATQIKEISDTGLVSVGSHTSNHYSLPSLSDEALDAELKNSKEYLEKLLNKEIKTICYPSGKYNSKVINKVSKYYDYALAIEGKAEVISPLFNRYEIKRFRVYRGTSFKTFEKMLSEAN